MVDAVLGKKYKLASSENFDEYMKAIGIGLVTRKVGNAVSPVIDLQKNGDEYVLSSSSTFKNFTTKFVPGLESDQETIDGRKVKATFTIDGNTINEVQKDSSGAVISIERKFSDNEVVMVMKAKDITCTRVYKLQA